MDKPTPPPEARLLRLVRTAAGIKAADAAATVDARSMRSFSASRWSQIENGYEVRGGEYKPVTANDATLAHMARAVGLTPERLETEGERPGAAVVLREMLASERPVPVREESALSAFTRSVDDPDDDEAAWLWPGPLSAADAEARRRIWCAALSRFTGEASTEAFVLWPGAMTAKEAEAFRRIWRLKFLSFDEQAALMRKYCETVKSPAPPAQSDDGHGLSAG